jgi:hypothetical protein
MDNTETSGLRQRLKQSRAFIFSLIAIAAIWLVSAMSEHKAYREHYKLYYDGIDTAKYAITGIDSILTLDITSNGFHAFQRGIKKNRYVHVNVTSKITNKDADNIQVTLNIDDYIDIIRSQIDTRGVNEIKPVGDILNIALARRQSKVFVPEIDNIDFQFDPMVGLCGQPELHPDSIVLYGSQSSLDKIEYVRTEPKTIKNIRISGMHRVRLANDWKKYPDVRPSTEYIDIFIPVETYTEKPISVAVQYANDNSFKRVQLYPSTVTLNCLVPRKKYADVNSDDFVVTAKTINDTSNYLMPVVTQFPANVRIKSISPQQLQYIIIK